MARRLIRASPIEKEGKPMVFAYRQLFHYGRIVAPHNDAVLTAYLYLAFCAISVFMAIGLYAMARGHKDIERSSIAIGAMGAIGLAIQYLMAAIN